MSTAAPSSPTQLGGFQIDRRLGAGGMAEVFLARKQAPRAPTRSSSSSASCRRTAPRAASARCSSRRRSSRRASTTPTSSRSTSSQDDGDEGLLLSMEYVEGLDLGKLMSAAKAKATRIPPSWSALHHLRGGKGLHYAHERKDEGGTPLDIVHRDVSPQNVLLSLRGRREDRRLRHRQRQPLPRGARRPQGQVRVHVARAGARREGRSARATSTRSASCSTSCSRWSPAARQARRTTACSTPCAPASSSRRPRTCPRRPARARGASCMRALAKIARRSLPDARATCRRPSPARSFAKQELVDDAAVEATHRAARAAQRSRHRLAAPSAVGDSLAHAAMGPPARHASRPARRRRRRGADGRQAADKKPPPRPSREVRHVAVRDAAAPRASKTLERRRRAARRRARSRQRSARPSTTSPTSAARVWSWEGTEAARCRSSV